MGPESFFCTPVPSQRTQGHAGPSCGLGYTAVVPEALGTTGSSSGVTGGAGDPGLGPVRGSAGVSHPFPVSSWVLGRGLPCCLCLTAHTVLSPLCTAVPCHPCHAMPSMPPMPCMLCIYTMPSMLCYPCCSICG